MKSPASTFISCRWLARGAWCLLAVGSAWAAAPNVVFILIDDLSHYGVTAYGANRLSSFGGELTNVTFSTPHMDRLAAEGLRCNYAYAYPLCEPTRPTLMSGKYNSRNHLVSKGQHAYPRSAQYGRARKSNFLSISFY